MRCYRKRISCLPNRHRVILDQLNQADYLFLFRSIEQLHKALGFVKRCIQQNLCAVDVPILHHVIDDLLGSALTDSYRDCPTRLYVAVLNIKAKVEKARALSPMTADSISFAIKTLENTPNRELIRHRKIKNVGTNVYSYRIDAKNRLIFGCKDDRCVLLDIINVNDLR
jgi:Txe/YoeB family toxin of Txe-Axe toxin-antitoxin module